MTPRRSALLLTALALLAGCGPEPREVGAATLLASPAVFGVGVLCARLVWRLWRRAAPEPPMTWWPIITTSVVLGLLAGLGAATAPNALELVGLAFVIYGASALSFMLVALRAWIAFAPRTAFSWALVPSMGCAVVLPLLMLATNAKALDDVTGKLWLFTGYFGVVPGVLLLGLLVEAAIRGRAGRRASL